MICESSKLHHVSSVCHVLQPPTEAGRGHCILTAPGGQTRDATVDDETRLTLCTTQSIYRKQSEKREAGSRGAECLRCGFLILAFRVGVKKKSNAQFDLFTFKCGFMQIFERAFSEHNTLTQKRSLDNQVQQPEQHVFSSCQTRYHGRNSPLQAAPWARLKSHKQSNSQNTECT